MYTERQVEETVAQGVSIMVCYYGDVRNPRNKDMMIAEIQMIADWAMETGMSHVEVEERILRPLGGELIDRYGYEVGPRLHAEFLEAFDNAYCER